MSNIDLLRSEKIPLSYKDSGQPVVAQQLNAANPGSEFWQGYGARLETTDAAEAPSTAYSMIVGQSFYGTLASGTDEDWVAIQLVSGQTYDFRLLGFSNTFLSDPLLRLYDSTGLQVATNDDGFSSGSSTHERDSELVFTATYTGTYYVAADAFSTETGGYLLSATSHQAAGRLFTVDEMAWQLLNNGQVFYGLPEAAKFNVGIDNSLSINLTALTAEGQTLARQALAAWTAVTGIAFTETAGTAEITFDDVSSGAFANPITTGSTITSATVNIGTDWLASFGTTLASYSFETYIHEIGHALGLAHAGNYNGASTYGIDNYYINDSVAWTIMSYINAYNDEFDFGNPGDVNTYVGAALRYIFTPQIADVIAIQYLYGEYSGAFLGNTVYGYNGNTGNAAIDGAINSGSLMSMTIYDSSGNDTLDFSIATTTQIISLYSESLSSVMGGSHNLGIARNVLVENAKGGSADDTIFGNDLANLIYGNGGADSLYGGNGGDNLWGGLGSDQHNGGNDATIDYARYDDANYGNLTIRLDGGANVGAAAVGDTYNGIEGLVGGLGVDTVVGNSSANYLFGGGAGDFIYGGGAADYLSGDAGGDNLWGGLGADQHFGGNDAGIDYARYDDANYGNLTIRLDNPAANVGAAAVGDSYNGIEGLVGGLGLDTVVGNNNANYLFGGGAVDSIYGLGGADYLSGDAGGDNLWGGLGADQHIGGNDAGIDYARYDDANYGNLTISLVTPASNTGAAAGDTYTGIEGLVGGLGADVVIGNSSANYLFGGGAGDFIDGLGGSDYLNGGAAADRFRFSTALGAGNIDTVADFTHLTDDMLLSNTIFAAIGASLTADEFRIGSALDANDYILYNNIIGALYYDSNGNGAGGITQFATVTAGTTLTFDDFIMV